MEVIICPTPDDVAETAAGIVAEEARLRAGGIVLGVATGSSPLGLYARLAARIDAGELDLSQARAFALDEYVGLEPGHPQSYHEVIRTTVTEPLRLDPSRVRVPDGNAPDLAAEAAAYERAIRDAGGIDVQILGVGSNGHIGFNEPTSSLASRTRIKTLTRRTREDNARFFEAGKVPVHCLTQGLGTIAEARRTLLVAQGEHKAEAVAQLAEGPVSARWPGTVLQYHPHCQVVVDEAAASRLELADYYRQVQEDKPLA